MSAIKTSLLAVVAVGFGALLQATRAQDVTETSPARFDDLVRDDFFAGLLQGDHEAFDRAMKVCEETLARNPGHAQAMVWHGSGLLFSSGQAFQRNEVSTGLELWQRGLREMNDAVARQPDDLTVLIPRGAALLSASKYDPDPASAQTMLKTGVADFERVLQLQQPYLQKLSRHQKGELLSGLADGWSRLGDVERSRQYLRQVRQECAGSEYARRASDLLSISDSSEFQQKCKNLSCIGCHITR